ncbi:transcriptional regulator [Rhodococcus erythropolis]|uniref:transcriptional regulator n=1 Tax=Rhodococcus erythropolis TaxID=1833 RepID=UPI0021086188|nr:transcriptional regulator [Rhodococcus erythropolis]MCQ4127673.1 transcriptional regulator [Rhodococcus erythropolis]
MNTAGTHVFRTHLNALFSRSETPLTNHNVAKEIRRRGYPLSGPYLSQLRTGVRVNPSNLVVDALADYFRVAPDFFFGPHPSDASASDGCPNTAIISDLHNLDLRRLLSACVGLSSQSLEILITMSDRLRHADRQ